MKLRETFREVFASRKCYTCRMKIDDVMAADWAAAFREIDPEIDARVSQMDEFLRSEISAGRKILPAQENIFRAFSRNLTDVKVLVVGQDPYPNPDFPVGLAFSVASEIPLTKIPASLKNIFRELADDFRENPEKFQTFAKTQENTEVNEAKNTTGFFAKNGDLSKWADQGVMLLNRSLTVCAGEPNSHAGKGWEKITEDAVKILANRAEIFRKLSRKNPSATFAKNTSEDQPLVAILWGKNAQNLAPIFAEANELSRKNFIMNGGKETDFRENIIVFASAHPSPLSARRGFFGSRPFSRTNEFLTERGAGPIDWNLG